MQDRTPNAIICSHCAFVIIPASKIQAYRKQDIQTAIAKHRCALARESKRDFESEVC